MHIIFTGSLFPARATEYGLEDEIDGLLRYLDTHEEVDDRLPKWDGLQELAADYEVPLP
ncbi:Transcriptional regulator, contains HTH domain (plasmid) [Halanaeroarchaeum sp. HSR-CO]|nr:Transcriptional regulator, contains HTH domain [Halanaeroarchaeum sp. HSR-CO]